MKKVALISPKGNIFGVNKRMQEFLTNSDYMESFRFLWTGPNLGLLYIAGLLPEEWDCDYIDENYRSSVDYGDYDLVFIGAMTQQIDRAYAIARFCSQNDIFTVIGGIHATILPEEAMQYADVVIAGEAEELLPEFIADYLKGNPKQLYHKEKDYSFDLRQSPLPRFELLKGYDYPIITLQTTRGCPHNCGFCAASKIYGKKYRRKQNEQILEELKRIRELFPGSLVMFADDNMLVLRNQTKALLRSMIGHDIRWIAQTDISIAKDDELLELMVLAGCQWVVIGFESVSEKSLQGLDDKNWKLRQMSRYTQSIATIQSHGISVYGTFIVGLDQDDASVFQATVDFIRHNNLYGANITFPTPLPGTELREKLAQQNRILDKDWSQYTFWDVIIQPLQLTIDELEKGVLEIYESLADPQSIRNRMLELKRMTKNRRAVLNKYAEASLQIQKDVAIKHC